MPPRKQAVATRLETLSGTEVLRQQELRGKLVLIDLYSVATFGIPSSLEHQLKDWCKENGIVRKEDGHVNGHYVIMEQLITAAKIGAFSLFPNLYANLTRIKADGGEKTLSRREARQYYLTALHGVTPRTLIEERVKQQQGIAPNSTDTYSYAMSRRFPRLTASNKHLFNVYSPVLEQGDQSWFRRRAQSSARSGDSVKEEGEVKKDEETEEDRPPSEAMPAEPSSSSTEDEAVVGSNSTGPVYAPEADVESSEGSALDDQPESEADFDQQVALRGVIDRENVKDKERIEDRRRQRGDDSSSSSSSDSASTISESSENSSLAAEEDEDLKPAIVRKNRSNKNPPANSRSGSKVGKGRKPKDALLSTTIEAQAWNKVKKKKVRHSEDLPRLVFRNVFPLEMREGKDITLPGNDGAYVLINSPSVLKITKLKISVKSGSLVEVFYTQRPSLINLIVPTVFSEAILSLISSVFPGQGTKMATSACEPEELRRKGGVRGETTAPTVQELVSQSAHFKKQLVSKMTVSMQMGLAHAIRKTFSRTEKQERKDNISFTISTDVRGASSIPQIQKITTGAGTRGYVRLFFPSCSASLVCTMHWVSYFKGANRFTR